MFSDPSSSRFSRSCLGGFLLLITLLGSSLGAAEKKGDELIAAAQANDLAKVRALLADGVDPNAQSRYGATALFFACDKVNLEMVRALLDRGADPEIKDTFYGTTAIGWVQGSLDESDDHRAIVLALVQNLREEGEDLDSLLLAAVEAEEMEIARTLIARQRVSVEGLRASRDLARSQDQDEMAQELTAALPEGEADEFSLSAERWEAMQGSYHNAEFGVTARLQRAEDGYQLFLSEDDVRGLVPRNQNSFAVLGSADSTLEFEPAEGASLRFIYQSGERRHPFERVTTEKGEVASADPAATPRVEPDPTPTVADSESPGAEPPMSPPAVRTAARPWPAFRGANRAGNADGQGVPTVWDGATGVEVAWKTPIPGLGLASPVVWGDRVFLATAVSVDGDDSLKTGLYGDVSSVEDDSVQVWKVLALDLSSGEVLWEQEATRGQPKVRRHLKSSHASPTPAVDAKRLVVSFGSAGLYCYDHAGKLLWKKDLGTLSSGWFYDPTYEWEFASSPILWGDKVLVQVDISGDSFVAAYDATSGEEVWRTERDEISSWGTPTLLENPNGPTELITNAPTIRGYDASTGEELWTLSPNSEITVASPVVGDGHAFVTGGYPPARPIYAIRPGSRGSLDLPEDATASEAIPWSAERGGTYIPTPIHYRGQLYVLHNNGRLVAYEAASGEEIYRARVGHSESFSASPIAADGLLFFSSEDGTTYVVRAGDRYDLVATNELSEKLMTTPAASDGLLLLRGHRHLFAIGQRSDREPASR